MTAAVSVDGSGGGGGMYLIFIGGTLYLLADGGALVRAGECT